jgi:hypothetical protein
MRRQAASDNVAALRLLSEFIGQMRRTLQHGGILRLNSHDPRSTYCPLSKLDSDILRLGEAGLLA